MSESTDSDAAILSAMWRIIADHGWGGLTMSRLAAASGVAPAEIRRRFPTRLDLLRLHGRVMDETVLRGTVPGQAGIPRDRIFDVLMRRVDAMQPHRPGILRLLSELRRDPLLALALAPHLSVSMAWMLEAAELDTAGLAGGFRVQGLTGIWLATIRAWEGDASEDLSATMAALDRALDRAEQIARTIRLSPGDLAAETPMAEEPMKES